MNQSFTYFLFLFLLFSQLTNQPMARTLFILIDTTKKQAQAHLLPSHQPSNHVYVCVCVSVCVCEDVCVCIRERKKKNEEGQLNCCRQRTNRHVQACKTREKSGQNCVKRERERKTKLYRRKNNHKMRLAKHYPGSERMTIRDAHTIKSSRKRRIEHSRQTDKWSEWYPNLAPRIREREREREGEGSDRFPWWCWERYPCLIFSSSCNGWLFLMWKKRDRETEREREKKKTNKWKDHRRTRFSSENKTHEKKPLSAFEKKNKIFFEFIYLPSSSLISLFFGETSREEKRRNRGRGWRHLLSI